MKSFGRMEMTGTAAGNSKLRLAGSALGAAAIVLLSTTLVSAEELRVIDAAGKTRSVADIAAGSSAAVNVTVAEKLTAPLSISLLNSKDNKVLHTTSADAKGFATFKNIESGTYKVTTTDSKASLATVEIVPTTSADQGAVEGPRRRDHHQPLRPLRARRGHREADRRLCGRGSEDGRRLSASSR